MEIAFPLGGLNRRRAFRQQPPFTTPDCLNVRPRGRGTQRQRGGTRPGHVQVFPTRIGTTYITGTTSAASYSAITNKITFTASSAVFTSEELTVGRTMHFAYVTGSFLITDWISTTQVKVQGGSTGLALIYAAETFYLLTGDPIRMMHSFQPVPVPYITGGLAASEADPFVGASDNEALNSTNWFTPSWYATKPVIINSSSTLAYNQAGGQATAVFKIVSLATTDPYTASILCARTAHFPRTFTGTITTFSRDIGANTMTITDSGAAFTAGLVAETITFGGLPGTYAILSVASATQITVTGIAPLLNGDSYSITTTKKESGQQYTLWAAMSNAASPVGAGTTNGVAATIELANELGTSWTLTLTQRVAGVATVLDSFPSTVQLNSTFKFELTIDESGTSSRAKVSVDGVEYATRLLSGSMAGQRCGFEIDHTNDRFTYVDKFSLDYTTTSSAVAGQSDDALLVASAGGGLFQQNSSGDMDRIPSRCTFTDDRMFMATDLEGKLYLADYGDVLMHGSDGVDGGSTTTFDAPSAQAGAADWTTWGIDIYRDVLVILNATGDLIDGAYKIASIAAAALTTTPACNTGASGGCAWRIVRGPKVYDPQGITVRGTATDGQRTGANTFNSATYANPASPDWSGLGIVTATDMLEITKQRIGGPLVSYHTITAVHATNGLTVTPAIDAGLFTGNHYFRVLSDPIKIWQGEATAGTVPAECPSIARYRGRLVMGGAPTARHVWYASRQLDANDWNYGDDPNDISRAFAATNADLGAIGNPINAIAASSDDYCLFGCDNEIWIMRGDGAAGGSLQAISYTSGIISRAAWAWGPAGEFVFLSRDGIREIAPGASSLPGTLTREVIPNELVDLSPLLYTPHMQYDARDGGFMVFATKGDGLSGTKQFWVEWPDRTFWPFDSAANQNPTASCVHTMIGGEERVVLMGGNTGLIWRMTTDAAVARDWSLTIGPLYPNRELGDGLVKSIRPVLGDDTVGTMTWQLWACRATESEQEMLTTLIGNSLASPARTDLSGTWSAGINNIARPRVRAHAFYIRLTGENEAEFERFIVEAQPMGMLRV